jgi:hypothetical protein
MAGPFPTRTDVSSSKPIEHWSSGSTFFLHFFDDLDSTVLAAQRTARSAHTAQRLPRGGSQSRNVAHFPAWRWLNFSVEMQIYSWELANA